MLDLLGYNQNFVLYFGILLAMGSVYLFARMLLEEQESRQAAETLDELNQRKASSKLLKYTRPFFTQYIVPMIRGKSFWDSRRIEYKRKIISGGLKDELTPDEFIAFKAVLIVVFPLILGVLKALDFLDLSSIFIFLSGILGWFYPDFWVKSRIEKRQKEVLKSMPFIVDLLALSTEAGLDFVGAMNKVVEKAESSPLVDEIEQVLKEIKVGSSRAEALREMGNRLNMQEIGSFVAILISADQMGASIGKTLRQQSDQIRSERFVRAEQLGAAVAPKLIVATVVFILPAVFLMVTAPFLISFLG
ncbi:MAG: pilus assembly protein TadC [Bdellovibrionaceae bacterium]|nr:pilus assembly protein TadC [Pseudobdellovibrionaceae bacterium]